MKIKFREIFTVLLGTLICFFITHTVFAAEGNEFEFTLEEITVTAQKRTENQQKVAIAMDVITGEDVRDLGKNDLNEILSSVSSAIIQKAEDGLRISIRGINDYTSTGSGNQPSATPTVAVNIDGVTSNRKDTGTSLYDLERVEVLYGPQSTLYATQSPGGIVNVVTASPKLDKFEGSGTLEVGNYSLIHTEGVVNVPVNDTIALRAAFTTNKRDGYISTGGDNEDSRSGRLKLLYKPNEKLSFQLTGEYSKDGGYGYAGGVVPFIDESDKEPWEGVISGSLGYNDQKRKKIFLNMEWDLGFATLTVLPSFFRGDGYREGVESNYLGLQTSMNWQTHEDDMYEVHLNSQLDSKIKWIVGYIYYDALDRNHNMSEAYLTTGEGDWRKRDMQEKQRALYGNITYPVTDEFRINAGARKSWDEYWMIQEGTTVFDPVTHQKVPRSEQVMENSGDPDLNLGFEYDLAEESMLYGSISSAYRLQGSYLGLDKPEELKSYQIGSKNRFFGNKLQVNAAGYYYDYKNFLARRGVNLWIYNNNDDLVQDSDETVNDPNAARQGDGRMIGLDLSASAIITQNDKIDMSFSYVNSKWTDLYFDFYYDEQYEINEAGDGLVLVDVENESYNGKTMTLTPPVTVNLNYTHTFNLWNGGSINTRLETSYQSDYRLTWLDDDYPYNYQEAHHIENLSATYNHSNGKWTFTSYVKNIADYAVKTMYRSDGSGYLTLSAPRTYGAVISIYF